MQAAYPEIGTLRRIVLTRNGKGEFGGRIISATLIGSNGQVSGVSGARLQTILSLRSAWFTIGNPDVLRRDVTADGRPDLWVTNSVGRLFRLAGTSTGDYTAARVNTPAAGYSKFSAGGDLIGNGTSTVFATRTGTSERACLRVYPLGFGVPTTVAGLPSRKLSRYASTSSRSLPASLP